MVTIHKTKTGYSVYMGEEIRATRHTLKEAENVVEKLVGYQTGIPSVKIQPKNRKSFHHETRESVKHREYMRKTLGITVGIEDIERDFAGMDVTTDAIMEKYGLTPLQARSYKSHYIRRKRHRESIGTKLICESPLEIDNIANRD